MNKIDVMVLELILILKKKGIVSSEYDFSKKIGKSPQNVNAIRNSPGRHFTVKDLYTIHTVFGVNINYLMGSEKNVFVKKGTQNSTQNEE